MFNSKRIKELEKQIKTLISDKDHLYSELHKLESKTRNDNISTYHEIARIKGVLGYTVTKKEITTSSKTYNLLSEDTEKDIKVSLSIPKKFINK